MSARIDSLRAAALEGGLARWLPAQRWFDGTGRALSSVSVLRTHVFAEAAGRLGALAVVQARDVLGADAGRYVLALGVHDRDTGPPGTPIAAVDDAAVHDALEDPVLVDLLVRQIARHRAVDGAHFVAETPGLTLPARPLTVRPLGAEQSNSSVVLDEEYILKVFRRLTPGASPDLVLHRLLRDAGSSHVPELLGAIEEEETGATLATLQRFLPAAEDGWAAALRSVRTALDAGARGPVAAGDFTASARALGRALADMHTTLATGHEPAPLRGRDCRRLSELFTRRLVQALDAAPQLAPYAGRLHSAFAGVTSLAGAQRPAQLTHGDLHLGQTLQTAQGWLLLDFEGEPLAGREERARLHSPMRDVAGMLRSFDYAAHHELTDRAVAPAVQSRAERWVREAQDAFLSGYATSAGPYTDGELRLLRAYELDKAVYEVLYDTQHRPSWAWIPLQALGRGLRSAAA
ncbi:MULTISPECIES: aminoglycoside phosphotransferase [unclassified Streptomyces]|uniref:maltokinase N-terminal cap-like domain-containing protein n=1 Tax=unclassified Streptomyces TaxID=2593676 RepID=UPI00380A37FF